MKPMNKQHILIAEDNPALAGVIKFNLERAGYQVSIARNGNQACQMAIAETFDLVISDQQMPGLNGIEVLSFLRSQADYRQTPFLMLTAKAMELDSNPLLEQLRISRLIAKPFSPAAIVREVDDIFVSHS
jgi:CheY-like chemotaxis protein